MSSLCWLICQRSRLFVVIRLDILLLVSALSKTSPNSPLHESEIKTGSLTGSRSACLMRRASPSRVSKSAQYYVFVCLMYVGSHHRQYIDLFHYLVTTPMTAHSRHSLFPLVLSDADAGYEKHPSRFALLGN